MTLATKGKLVAALVAFLAIWPLVQHVTVRALDLNPWHFGGWAMYATPPRFLRHRVEAPGGRELKADLLPPHRARQVRLAYRNFLTRRLEWGDRVKPDDYARALFEAFREVDRLKITVEDLRIDRESAMIRRYRISDPPYRYRRSELLE
jgi:hypothetical protein